MHETSTNRNQLSAKPQLSSYDREVPEKDTRVPAGARSGREPRRFQVAYMCGLPGRLHLVADMIPHHNT